MLVCAGAGFIATFPNLCWVSRLWDLVSNRQRIEPADLRDAITEQLRSGDLDYRTRLLMQESAAVLREKFGMQVDSGEALRDVTKPGFPSLRWKVGAMTKPAVIEHFLRQLGRSLMQTTEIVIGGSSALILQGLLARNTEDVDVVDEVPAALRNLRIAGSELHIAHFQSHYLPEGWNDRRQSRGDFGKLRVYLVHGMDIYVGKLFSVRDKDKADLRYLQPHFERESVREHLIRFGHKLAGDPKLRQAAEDNWYIQYAEELPVSP